MKDYNLDQNKEIIDDADQLLLENNKHPLSFYTGFSIKPKCLTAGLITFFLVGGTGFTLLSMYEKSPNIINSRNLIKINQQKNSFLFFHKSKLAYREKTNIIDTFNYTLLSSYNFNNKLKSENRLTKLIF